MSRAVDRAYATLRERITNGEYAAGDRLREENLAEALGVSRTPVREALRRLDMEGFVVLVPHRGAHVVSWSPRDLEEIFGLRAVLEGYAARLAALRVTDEDVAALADLAERMSAAAATDPPKQDRIVALNADLHERVITASGNQRLRAALVPLVQAPLVHRAVLHSPDLLARCLHHHQELVTALAARNPDWAEATMRAHLCGALESLRLACDGHPAPPQPG